MIRTIFGSEIELLEDLGEGWYKVRRKNNNTIHEWHISEFKGDIQKEIEKLEAKA